MADPKWDDTEPAWDDTIGDEEPVVDVPVAEPDKMGAMQAAAVSADPFFINPQIGGLAAMAGEAVGRPSGIEASADKAIAKTEKAIEKYSKKDLTKAGNLKRLKGLQENLGDLKKLRDPSYKDVYRSGEASTKELEAKAFEDQPASSVAGMIAGGAVSPLPGASLAKLGKAGKLASKILPSTEGAGKIASLGRRAKKAESLGLGRAATKLFGKKSIEGLKFATREGAKAGALSGMSRGDAKLLDGDITGFISDTVVGTGLGATSGVVMDRSLRVTGKILTNSGWANSLKKIYKEGAAGKYVDKDFVEKDLIDLSKKYIESFKKKLKGTGANIGKLYDDVSDPGEMIDAKEFVNRLRNVAENSADNDRATISKVINILDDHSLGGRVDTKMTDSLEKKLLKKRLDNAGVVEKAKIKQADKDLKAMIEQQERPVSIDDLGEVSSKDMLPGGGPEVKAQVSHKITESVDESGQRVHSHSMGAQKIKEHKPSGIQQGVDDTTGREFAVSLDKGTGDVYSVVGDVKKEVVDAVSISEMHKIVVKLGKVKLGTINEQTKSDLQKVTKDIRNKIVSSIKDKPKKEELIELNKTYSGLKDIEDRIGLNHHDHVKVKQNVQKIILGVGDKGDANSYIDFIKNVKKVDPKLAHEIQTEVASLRFRSDISKHKEDYINSMSSHAAFGTKGVMMSLLGKIGPTIAKGVNALGRTQHSITSTARSGKDATKKYLANRTLNLTQSSSDDIKSMMKMIEGSKNSTDKHFLGPLKKALEANSHRSKQTIMYGLSQQQAFIDTINSINAKDSEED